MKKNDISKRAAQARAAAEEECAAFNDAAEEKALEAYSKSDAAKYLRSNAAYATGLLVRRAEIAAGGGRTFPLRPFDAETIARLLTVNPRLSYVGKTFDDELSDEETLEAELAGTLVTDDAVVSIASPASAAVRRLRDAFAEYVRAAAVYAKHVRSESLLLWAEMADFLESAAEKHAPIGHDDAVRLIELEKRAADRLRLDRFVDGLPPFKAKKCRRGKAL